MERVTGRRTDPVTGKIYHMKFSPPPNDPAVSCCIRFILCLFFFLVLTLCHEQVLGRLQQRKDDTEETVKVRVKNFHRHINAIIDVSFCSCSLSLCQLLQSPLLPSVSTSPSLTASLSQCYDKILVRVDGDRDKNAVFADIKSAIDRAFA